MFASTETPMEPLLMTARQTARALCISERLLYSITKLGELKAVRCGRRVLYDPADVRAWIESAKNS